MDLPELLILRHGETEWNAERRMQGDCDSQLTARGAAQAALQGRILRSLDVAGFEVVCSPQGRALHTAEIALGLERSQIATDSRLREIGIGRWAGMLLADIRDERPDLFETPLGWYGNAPGGETLDSLWSRAEAFLAELARPTIVVTHGITSRMLRCCATGRAAGDFRRVEGGQGVVFRVRGQQITRLAAPVSRARANTHL